MNPAASTPGAAVLVERVGHTMIITINRPEVRNAVDQAVHVGVGTALAAADDDHEVRSVILTGAGGRSFCAGADLKAAGRGKELLPADERMRAWGFAGFVRHAVSVPTIAAVNGAALGGGTELVLAADLAVAATTATFGLPEVKRGVLAAAGGAFRIGQQVSRKRAMELLLTGDPITADDALAIGLVNRVVGPEDLRAAALALAERVNANSPVSVRASKRIALGQAGGGVPDEEPHWRRTADEQAGVRRSSDFSEGLTAFAERRPPAWTGA